MRTKNDLRKSSRLLGGFFVGKEGRRAALYIAPALNYNHITNKRLLKMAGKKGRNHMSKGYYSITRITDYGPYVTKLRP